MKLDDRVALLRKEALKAGRKPVPKSFQRVTKARIRAVLEQIDLCTPDICDAVFALLDTRPGWFPEKYKGLRFCDAASTAHLACHIGVLQRGRTKLDREGRDYWIKPLRDVGAIEPMTLDKDSLTLVPGHAVAKSPNSCYRLADSFRDILVAPDNQWKEMLKEWIRDDKVRERNEIQGRLAQESRDRLETKHSDLIAASVKYYAPRFLPGFDVIYIDDGDGDRITDEQRQALAEAGLDIELQDSMPDVLLWNPKTDALWVIEAVTSDGEVDEHKVARLTEFARRNNKEFIGFTTTYQTWKAAAARQGRHKNIATDSYIWIQEDGGRQLRVT